MLMLMKFLNLTVTRELKVWVNLSHDQPVLSVYPIFANSINSFDGENFDLQKAIISKKYKPYEYCGPMKMILPPQQTKYCKMTKKAIRGFDHHCLFLEKSIGHGTHHYFMLFMMAQG